MEQKIVQIMQAPPNLFAIYKDGGEEPGDFRVPVLCLALTNDGEILMMDADKNGSINSVHDVINFTGIEWKD